MGIAVCGLFPPILLWASLFKGEERKRLERGTPVFVPPPAKLADGTYGPTWSEDQEDPILTRTSELVKALDAKATSAEIEVLVEDVARRARELVGNRSIEKPSPRSNHHYWPNKEITNGSGDDKIVSYDDNLPIQGQKLKLREILTDLRNALSWVSKGVDSQDIVTEVLDLVAALRRIVELSGHDAGPLRGKPQPMITAPVERTALPRQTPECVTKALADVRRVLDLDPEAVDGLGNRIEPLTAHALRMYEAHKDAYAIAGADQKPMLDGQLERAMGYVSEAARQGLEIQQRKRIDRVGTELRFMATRSGDHS